MPMTRRDQVYFCIVGTLLSMAIVVHQGDYSGYKAALAARAAGDGYAVAPIGTQDGYRTTPASGDPYQYIRTGTYPIILAREAEVQRQSDRKSVV